MSKSDEARKFWDEKIMPKERELKMLSAECKKAGRRTKAYENAVKDMNKLKAEYEAILGTAPYDPMNQDQVESQAAKTARQFLGYREER